MLKFSTVHIEARDKDFETFRKNDSLGEHIRLALKPFVYKCAQDAFYEAWLRGLKWGWAQANIELNERAIARMRRAFNFVYGSDRTSHQEPIKNGIPKQDTLDMSWYRQVVPHIAISHLKTFADFHAIQSNTVEDKFARIVHFYHDVLSLAWAAGWTAGETFAMEQHRQRESDLGMYEDVDKAASQMEKDRLFATSEAMLRITAEDLAELRKKLNSGAFQTRPT